MNRPKNLISFAAAALLVCAFAAAASAQVASVSGKVFLKKADGTAAPLPGATVKFYRTDIKQEFEAKTDKSGRYVYAGLPFVGTFTVVVSGPGAAPTYRIGFRAANNPENDVTLEPGDGRSITLADIGTLEAMKGKSGKPVEGVNAAEAKKKADEIAAERKRVEAENAKATEINAKAPEILKAGNEAFGAKNWDLAITKYDEGIALLPDDPVFYRNKAVALFSRGRDKYNAAVRVKPNDQAGITAAREDMKGATEAAEKAVGALESKGSGGAAPAPDPSQPNKALDLLSTRAEAYRLALTTSTTIDNDAAAKAIEAYINAEPDQAKKDATQASLGDALRFAGKYDEAIAKFREALAKNPNNLDAIFGLGIALASKSGAGDSDPALVTEARDALKQFVAKAPDTNPRKQEAAGMVTYLDETVKGMAASKEAETKGNKTTRRKP
ncbi:MAG TPA: tetratricopeptide repeat protein [Pyrinomonadaceae bacterium]|nr:tetratricopeptide repeat protein [Pyrinomonadaceae bacterium]